MQMAAAAVGRAQVPWRAILHDLSHNGEDHKNCLATLENNVGSYVISPPVTRRSRRPSQIQKGKTIRLTTATLIIVPQNLISQWKDEISLHVEDQFLEVLYLDSDAIPVPSATKLMKYDVVLLSRQRFEREMIPKGTAKARSKSKFKGMYIRADLLGICLQERVLTWDIGRWLQLLTRRRLSLFNRRTPVATNGSPLSTNHYG